MKIIVISLAGIGDTIMATPLLHELRNNFPEAEINVLVMWKGAEEILKNNPYVTKVIYFNMIKEGPIKTMDFCRKLRKENYDISINTFPQSKIEYRIISKLIGAKKRFSHRYGKNNFVENILINNFIEEDYSKQCAENNLDFIGLLGKRKLKNPKYEIFLSGEEMEFAKEFIRENNLGGKKIIGFHIGSGSTKNLSSRRWPLKNYIELSEKLLNFNEDISILLFGKEEEKENEKISEIDRNRIKIVKTNNIKETASVARRCKIFLSVDTALMHIASAMEVSNQLVIETPTFNETVYPYNKPFITVKNPAILKNKLEYYKYDGKPIKMSKEEIRKIMEGVSVENVFEEIKKLMI